jgi:hypothetical protein
MDLWIKEQTPPTLPRGQSLRKQTKLEGVISESKTSAVSQVSAKLMIWGEDSLMRISSSPSLLGKLQQFSNIQLRTASALEPVFNMDPSTQGFEAEGGNMGDCALPGLETGTAAMGHDMGVPFGFDGSGLAESAPT